ncbi:MAG: dTMP kinase [bacterium]
MKSKLIEIFTTFENTNINYCLLRGYDDLKKIESFKEIDLLVAPGHLKKLANMLAKQGFVELPNWGHKPHFFYVAYLHETGMWLKFDVVTELRYGKPIRLYRVGLANECLSFRQKRELAYTLAPEHELITLLLHCLLDKGAIKPAYASRLQELHKRIKADSAAHKRFEEYISYYFAPAMTLHMLRHALEAADWQLLLNQSKALGKQLHATHARNYFLRKIFSKIVLKLRPLFFMLRRKGLYVALLAADGAGKSTLASRLVQDKTIRAQLVYMGTNINASTVGLPTTKWLHARVKAKLTNPDASGNGRLKKPTLVNKILRALNFINKLAEKWYRIFVARYLRARGRFVVFDRYIYDSWLVQRPNTLWKKIRRLLFEKGYPKPDLVIFLDAPGEVLFKRKGEHTPEWLEQQRQGYLALKQRIPQMVVIDATQQADAVEREVKSLIWSHYRFRSGETILNGNGNLGITAKNN